MVGRLVVQALLVVRGKRNRPMTWSRIDDQFYTHPKVGALDLALMPAAVGLHVLALSWCANQLTDGKVPRPQVVRLIGDPIAYALADELVRVGLWEETKAGYAIHDYLDYNPTREKVIAEREAARTRMQRFRGSSGEVHANNGRSSATPVPVIPEPSKEKNPPAPLWNLARSIPGWKPRPNDAECLAVFIASHGQEKVERVLTKLLTKQTAKHVYKDVRVTLGNWLNSEHDPQPAADPRSAVRADGRTDDEYNEALLSQGFR